MLSTKVLHLLNRQIRLEGESAQIYLSMHTWAADYGLEGTAKWFLEQYQEEKVHMLKFVKYINDRGSRANVSQLDAPAQEFTNCLNVFEETLKHETYICKSIKEIIKVADTEGDLQTCAFLHWFMIEQNEEEESVRRILDRVKWSEGDKAAILATDCWIGKLR